MVTPVPSMNDITKRRILIVLLVALFMSLVSVSIMNVCLPAVQTGIGASNTELQWVLSGFSLTFGVVIVASGRAGDLYGRERIFIVGTAVFMLSSLVAALSPTPLVLNVARAVMGLGAGILTPQITGLIQQMYQGAKRAWAFGIFGATTGVGVAIGPVIGGALLGMLPHNLGWRATLGINVPLAFLVMIIGIKWMPRSYPLLNKTDNNSTDKTIAQKIKITDLDPVGALLLAICVLFMMLPFMLASRYPAAWWFLAPAVLLGIIWLVWEHYMVRVGHKPMVDLQLFKIRSFTLGTLMIAVYFAGRTTVWVVVAQFVQDGMHRSALESGLIAFPASLAVIVASIIGAKIVVRLRRWLVVIGVLVALVGLVLTAYVAAIVPPEYVWLLAITTIPIGFSSGWITSPNATLTLREVPLEYAGTASGIMQTGQRISTAVGTAAVTGLYFHTLPQGAGAAFDKSFLLIGGFAILALVIALADAILDVSSERSEF